MSCFSCFSARPIRIDEDDVPARHVQHVVRDTQVTAISTEKGALYELDGEILEIESKEKELEIMVFEKEIDVSDDEDDEEEERVKASATPTFTARRILRTHYDKTEIRRHLPKRSVLRPKKSSKVAAMQQPMDPLQVQWEVEQLVKHIVDPAERQRAHDREMSQRKQKDQAKHVKRSRW